MAIRYSVQTSSGNTEVMNFLSVDSGDYRCALHSMHGTAQTDSNGKPTSCSCLDDSRSVFCRRHPPAVRFQARSPIALGSVISFSYSIVDVVVSATILWWMNEKTNRKTKTTNARPKIVFPPSFYIITVSHIVVAATVELSSLQLDIAARHLGNVVEHAMMTSLRATTQNPVLDLQSDIVDSEL